MDLSHRMSRPYEWRGRHIRQLIQINAAGIESMESLSELRPNLFGGSK